GIRGPAAGSDGANRLVAGGDIVGHGGIIALAGGRPAVVLEAARRAAAGAAGDSLRYGVRARASVSGGTAGGGGRAPRAGRRGREGGDRGDAQRAACDGAV